MWQISDRFSVSSPGVLEGFDAGWFLQKLLKMLGNYIIFISEITRNVAEWPAISQATIMVPAQSGPSTLCPWCPNTWTMFFPMVGLGGVVQYSGHHVLPISLLWISLSGGDEVFGVRDTDRRSRRAGCLCGRSCSNYSWESFSRRYQLCISVNGRHFQQLL